MAHESKSGLQDKILDVIRSHPGIRASQINRQVGREHTWRYRKALIKQRLVRREKDGSAVRYYPRASDN